MHFAMKLTAGLCAAAVMSAPTLAADIYDGHGGSLKDPYTAAPSVYYFALRGGATFAEDTDFTILDGGVRTLTNEYEDPGLFVSGAVGMSMTSLTGVDGLRGEVEFGYLQSDVDRHVESGLPPISSADSFGETSAFFGLVNLFYDFNQFGRLKPFIGGGVGFANVDFDGHAINDPANPVMDDGGTGFAYQLSAGANFALTESIDIEIGYRYMGVTDVDLTSEQGVDADIDFDSHIIYGGLRFKM